MTSALRLASPPTTRAWSPLATALALCIGLGTQPAAALSGRVVDGASGQPIPEATVTQGTQVVRSDSAGRYTLPDGLTGPVGARAPGYRQARVDASTTAGAETAKSGRWCSPTPNTSSPTWSASSISSSKSRIRCAPSAASPVDGSRGISTKL